MATPFRLLACLGSITALLFATPALSTLRIVPDQFPSIQSAINAAATGDSIMVRAGTYVESLALSAKNLTIFGESGSQATTITTNYAARVATLGSGVTAQTVLSDLTIRQGSAGDGGGMILTGGASPILRRCRLVENWAYRSEGSTWGGAILVGSGSQLLIEDCVFDQNRADYFCCLVPGQGHGGAISASSGSTIRVVRTEFVLNQAGGFEGGFGGAIHVASNATAVIEDCRFESNGGYGGGVGAESANVTIDRCVFTDHVGYLGAAISTSYGRTIVRSCLFYDNFNWGEAGVVYIGPSNQPGEFRNNTVAFNRGDGIYIWQDVAKNNIIVGNEGVGLTGNTQPPGAFSCNDVWNNEFNYGGPDLTGIDGNISVDPLFCNAAARDLHLHQSSPCAAPGPCGLIGALGIACGVTGVDPGSMVSQPLRLLVDPNPMTAAGGQLTLIGGDGPATIEIVSAQGRVVERIVSKVNQRIAWAPGSKLAAGVYFARAQMPGGSLVTKFMIIR